MSLPEIYHLYGKNFCSSDVRMKRSAAALN